MLRLGLHQERSLLSTVHLAVVRPVCLVLLVAWIVSIKEIFISKIKTCEIFQSVTWPILERLILALSFKISILSLILENVKMPLYVKNMTDKEMVDIAERELSRLGIGDFIKKNVKQLSGGQKQRVAIARALVNNPEMIVADEPTGSLDSQSQENVLEIFKELAEAGKTVIIVTHNPEVADYADVVIKMKDGEVVETIEK